jgi:hypothetical protein
MLVVVVVELRLAVLAEQVAPAEVEQVDLMLLELMELQIPEAAVVVTEVQQLPAATVAVVL